MLTAYERRLLAFYLANAASRLHYRDCEASNLADWVADRANGVSTFGTMCRRSRVGDMDSDSEVGMSARKWHDLQRALCDEHEATRKARHDRTAQRLRRLGKAMCLTRTDIDILELLLRYQTQPVIEAMIDHVFGVPRRLPITPLNVRGTALASFLGVSARTINGRLRENAPLVQSGLVSVECDGDVNVVCRLRHLASAGGPLAAMRWQPTGRRRRNRRGKSGLGGIGNELLRSKMCASILAGHRLTLWRHERAAIHREGPQMGAGPECGGAFRGLRRCRFAWNALCGRSQNDRQGPEEGNRQGTARQDARRPWNRQGRFLDGTTVMSPEDRRHARHLQLSRRDRT